MKIFIICTFLTLLCTIHTRISPSVTIELTKSPHANIIILFKHQVNFNQLPKLDIESRAHLVVHSLQQLAQKTQYRIIKFLESHSIEYISFWSTNCIAVYNANRWLIEKLDEFSEVDIIGLNEPVKALNDLPNSVSLPSQVSKNQTIEWGIKWIKADQVWEKGIYGQNIIVGSIDTGVQWDHVSLKSSYLGMKQDGQVDHNYAWFDGLRKCVDCKYPNICGYNLTVPCDDYGHGTHVIGTMAASNFATGRIFAVAPKSRWMACRSMDHGLGDLVTFLYCMQFMLSPTDVYGKNPDPSKRPHVLANSYGCSSYICNNTFKQTTEACRAAGIVIVASAGNYGSCSNINSAPAFYEATIAVGALAKNSDKVTKFSDRGPVTVDRSNRIKPDFVAPGDAVYSCTHRNRYTEMKGTSMACPHVAGAIALLWSAFPKLVRDVDTTIKILQTTARHQESLDCKSPQKSPNNVYGYGTVDVLAAYEYAMKTVV